MPDDLTPSAHDRRRRPRRLPDEPLTTRAAFLDAGADDAAIRHGLRNDYLVRVAHGLYAPGGGPHAGPEDRLRSGLRSLTGDGRHALSHTTAQVFSAWRASPSSVLAEMSRPLHLTRVDGRKLMRHSGLVAGHRTEVPGEHLRWVDGIRTVSPAWAWADTSPGMSVEDLVVAADQLLRPPRPEFGDFGVDGSGVALAEPGELEAVLAARGGAPGVRRAREAAGLARVGADSPQESRLRLAMHRAGLPAPLVNALIHDADGRPLHRPDLSFPKFRVCVEYDGRHHADPRQAERDVARSERAEAGGWIEVRITARHAVRQWLPAIEKIVAALVSRGWRPEADPL